MKGKKKKILFIACVIVALCLVAFIAFLLIVDVNAFKPRAEVAISDALGMDVKIDGKMGIVLFPRFGISLENVRVENRKMDVVSLEKVRIGLKIIPLLKREVRISEFGLIQPKFTIERDKSRKFNFETSARKPAREKERPLAALTVRKFFISRGVVVYRDKRSDKKTKLKEFDLTISNFAFSGDGVKDLLQNISFTGNFSCKQLRTNGLEVSDLMFAIRWGEGIVSISPLTMDIFNGKGKGTITVDVTEKTPLFRIHYAVSGFRFEKFLGAFSQREMMKGRMDFSTNLSMRGKSLDEIKRTVSGDVSLKGETLSLSNLDLDRLLAKYRKSQSFNIVDVGAFFFVGPFGPMLTKGHDFTGVYKSAGGGEGMIQRLVSEWNIENGIAETRDAAFATKQNRIALKGRLDFMKEQFDDVTIAVLNKKGCPEFSQKIRGPFRNPQVEKASVLKSIAGPVLKIFEKTKAFVTRGKCKVFYEGSVKHPM